MLNPRTNVPISWELTVQEKLPTELKSRWESLSADFRRRRDDLAQLVRDGEMTVKAARNRAAELAEELAKALETMTLKEKSRKPLLSNKLAEAERARHKPLSPDAARSKTMELLMHNLTELQIANRKDEFEARTFVKAAANMTPVPSIEKLFELLNQATESGDAPAAEWSRRQLERLREFTADESVRDRIDLACDRPRVLNRRLIRKYLEGIVPRLQEKGFVEALLEKAIEAEDANACAAVFEIARIEPESVRPEALERIMASLERIPDQAIRFACRTDRDAAVEETGRIDRFLGISKAWIEKMAQLDEVRQPTEAELQRIERAASLPPLATDEPIGLIARGFTASTAKPLEASSPASEPESFIS